MISKIFINLPVKDLDKSMDFFKAVGFSFNPQFTDKTASAGRQAGQGVSGLPQRRCDE